MPELRRGHASSWKRDRPDGVIHGFQVILYKVDPFVGESATRSLLSKNDWRAALLDEPMPGRPEVPLVSKPAAFACLGERLAWAGASPDGTFVGPPGLPESEGPEPDAGEEMALGVAAEVIGTDVLDGPGVHVSGRKKSSCDETAEPFAFFFVDLIVVGPHVSSSSRMSCSIR
jgi:hypothetical protein